MHQTQAPNVRAGIEGRQIHRPFPKILNRDAHILPRDIAGDIDRAGSPVGILQALLYLLGDAGVVNVIYAQITVQGGIVQGLVQADPDAKTGIIVQSRGQGGYHPRGAIPPKDSMG
jgi:hypothetical protein